MAHRRLRLISLVSALSACAGSAQPTGGAVCPTCGPEAGGDTGDFGTSTRCWGLSQAVPIDADEAMTRGFDVPELERRISLPIDLAFTWRATDTRGGEPATGYSSAPTRLRGSTTSTPGYRHLRIAPELCDETRCSHDGDTWPKSECPERLETDVTLTFSTDDGAVRGTMHGVAWSLIGDDASEGAVFRPFVIVDVRANLSDVTGTLRLWPEPGGVEYQGSLGYSAWYTADGPTDVSLSAQVLITHADHSATQYWPLTGAF